MISKWGPIAFVSAAAVAFTLTFLTRKYALARALLDRPNARSLHDRPVPRGGGAAIVVTFLLGTVVLSALHAISVNVAIAFIGGGVPVAIASRLEIVVVGVLKVDDAVESSPPENVYDCVRSRNDCAMSTVK